MKLIFRILEIPSTLDPFKFESTCNIPMLGPCQEQKPTRTKFPGEYYLWFLWNEANLKFRLHAGHYKYNLKRIS